MASCPNCQHKLKPWNIKAECPACGVNIPNYNWEERLDEDSVRAEAALKKFGKTWSHFKSALFGTKLRVLRFVCTFLPLTALVLPLAEGEFFAPFIDRAAQTISLLNITLKMITAIDIGAAIKLFSSDIIGSAVLLMLLSIVLLYLAVVFGVLNFVFVIINAPGMKARSNAVLSALAAICFAAAGILFVVFNSMPVVGQLGIFSGSLSYGLFVGIALFTLNAVLNTVVGKGYKKQLEKEAAEEEKENEEIA
ncbi:MAG: hypothetical protein GX851_05220 [Clostridiales bacterium]|nr:hypothetical protein [Clostridiales bacterium]